MDTKIVSLISDKMELVQIQKLSDKIIRFSFFILIFSLPLIFIPGQVEIFQFNKMMLVYLLTVVITAAWAVKMIAQKQMLIKRTPLDLPIILFLGSQIASTLLSIEPYTSVWGYYSRFHQGLLSTISYTLLYYAFVSNFTLKQKGSENQKNQVLISALVLLSSSLIVSVYGILEHFGIDEHYWIQDVRNRVFSTLGQPNWLAAFLAAVSPLTFIFPYLPSGKKAKQSAKSKLLAISLAASSIFYLTILYTKSRSGLLGFSAMFVCFWSLIWLRKRKSKSKLKANKQYDKHLLLLPIILAAITLIVGSPFTPSVNHIANKLRSPQRAHPKTINQEPAVEQPASLNQGGTPSEDIRKIVWKGALDIWKNWPIFGSGVETFAYSYYRFRPKEHNFVSEWNFLYNKAHNEYLNLLATTGIIGLGTYLLIQTSYLLWSLKMTFSQKTSDPESKFAAALASGYIGMSFSNFFGFSTVTTGLLFYLFPALSFSYIQTPHNWIKLPKTKSKSAEKETTLQTLSIIFAILVALYFILQIGIRWYADRLFAKGRKLANSDQLSQALIFEQRSSDLVPDEPLFHNQLALDFARSAAALKLAGQATNAAQLAQIADLHSDLALVQNPVHLNYLKNRAAAMIHLASINPDYYQKAIATLKLGKQLSPTDPTLPYNLGLIYQEQGDLEQAIEEQKQALELKPDFEIARIALASIFEKKADLDKAIDEYQALLEIDPLNPTAQNALERLATMSAEQE